MWQIKNELISDFGNVNGTGEKPTMDHSAIVSNA
jgi:hypothetical protein